MSKKLFFTLTAILILGITTISFGFSQKAQAAEDTGISCDTQDTCDKQAPGSTCYSATKTCVYLGKPASEWIITPESKQEALKKNIPSLQTFGTANFTGLISDTILAVGGATLEKTDAQGNTYYERQGGAIDILANLTGSLYQIPPVSSTQYLADIGQTLGFTIAPPVYAQGLGFQAFSPILPLWKTFRNIAYLCFVIIFVIVGFMIMFRKKIDPRTVVTIQDSLPRIVVSLILVTFSYAIAGLIVDFSELSIRIIGNTLAGEKLIAQHAPDNPQNILNELFRSNIFDLVNPLRGTKQIQESLGQVGELGPTIGALGRVTVRFIFELAGFFIMFKIFFALLGPYVAIILSVIFAPFQLMLSALPGTNTFGNWLKQLLANIVVFPVTFALLAIVAILKSGPQLAGDCFPGGTAPKGLFGVAPWCPPSQSYSTLWSPPLIGNWGSAVGHLAGFGILFAIPKVAEMVKEALGVKAAPWGAVAGREIQMAASKMPVVGGYIARQMPGQ